jgi:hypothetical protein
MARNRKPEPRKTVDNIPIVAVVTGQPDGEITRVKRGAWKEIVKEAASLAEGEALYIRLAYPVKNPAILYRLLKELEISAKVTPVIKEFYIERRKPK